MRALVSTQAKDLAVQEVPIPQINTDEILVKVVAAAQNPIDPRQIDTGIPPGRILGQDWAGTVVQLGENVLGIEVGDRVAGFGYGGLWNDRGAFAEYVKSNADTVFKIPDSLSFEQAATIPAWSVVSSISFSYAHNTCSLWTAIQVLHQPKRLGLVGYPERVDSKTAPWVLIYGGATSTGLFAIQLLRLAGYRVVTTSSPKNFGLLKSLGATAVIDYKDPDVVNKIKEVSGDSIAVGLDAWSAPDTQAACIRSFRPEGGRLIIIKLIDEKAAGLRPEVELQRTWTDLRANRR
jgi:NADPH:quinone reductase-like Zn-dependent oxidoreductase